MLLEAGGTGVLLHEAVVVTRGMLLEAGGTGALLCEAVGATKGVLKLEPGVLPGGRYRGEGT